MHLYIFFMSGAYLFAPFLYPEVHYDNWRFLMELLLSGFISGALLIYLFYALFHPEKF